MVLVYKADPARAAEWARIVAERAPGLAFHIWPDTGDPWAVRYLAAWLPPDDILGAFPNLEILFSIGAGVDQLDLSKVPAHVPVVRMIEPGIVDGMIEYAAMAVLALHRDLVPYIAQQRAGQWKPIRVWPASTRRVGVLGLGRLGAAVAQKLAGFGFDVAGWSRSPRSIEGVASYAGADTLDAFLARTDILVCLLPLTPATHRFLDGPLLAKLPRGACLVSAGRGGHLDQDALIEALDNGRIAAAVLDVTEPEPLPAGHRLWTDPRVLITPHVASMTQPATAAVALLENIARHEAGQPMVGVIDRARGY